jgi:hypothetical protein
LPSITSMSPLAAAAGGSQLVRTVNGDFRHDAAAKWSGFTPVDNVAATMENHVQMRECEPLF